ncbi:hypothetical protein AB0G73_10830 [Streptomyces sp. NPDC020719]|uniref:deoxynucleotide monophosphate kinase family protein n=1 Tax=Streptomyces sp. NPDC020719 TaxID=3154896 RepID=UPI0033D05EC9
MKAPLIGLAGAARSGKDTAAQTLLELGWERRAFADKVKDFLYALNPWIDAVDDAEPDGLANEVDRHGWDAVKEESWEVRHLLQRCGTEAGRQLLGENVWVDALFRDFETWGPTVVTDVRFPNEAEAIRARGGLVVHISRPDQAFIPQADHVSERALDGWTFDASVQNDGSVENLHRKVRGLITAWCETCAEIDSMCNLD